MIANPPEPAKADADVLRTLGADRSGAAKRWVGRIVWLVVLAGIIAAVVFGVRRWRAGPGPVRYKTAQVRRGDVIATITATGTLEPVHQVDVGPEISGRIIAVHVTYNDHVTRGELLAELDPQQLRAQADQASAQLAAAEATIEQARANLHEAQQTQARTERLHASENATDAQLEQARAATERAQAALSLAEAQARVARAALNAARTSLGKTSIYCPIDGVVLSRNAEPGQTVVSALQTQVLFTIAEDLGDMELRVDVDEADIGRAREGQRATFTVDAFPGRQFEARMVALHNAPRVVQNVVTYEGVLAVDNHERLLRPGMTATASIVTDTRRNVLLVPNSALRFVPPEMEEQERQSHLENGSRRSAHVWVPQPNGHPRSVDVQVGATDGRSTELVGNRLTEGRKVLTDVDRAGTSP